MLLKYLYNSDLAQAAYLVGCQAHGVALVVDPGRDVRPYLAEAAAQGLRIVAVTETHIHADYVSGARELAAATGATLYLSDEGGAGWQYQYLAETPHRLLKDGDSFFAGNIRFDVLHTPGHTPEHIALLLTDTAARDAQGAARPMGVFTGDFVFVGDVGRPDLLERAAGVKDSAAGGARQMFRSLDKFRALPDYLQVWPGHGAGSACGKALGAIPSSTAGYEKLFNWALAITDEAAFVAALLAGQPEPPTYFAQMKRVNKEGPVLLADLPAWPRLTLDGLEAALAAKLPVVDLRPAGAFAAGHIPGTINIPFDGSFVTWAGWLLPYDRPHYLIAADADPTEQELDRTCGVDEVRRALRSIGLDQTGGVGSPALLRQWVAAGRSLQSIAAVAPETLAQRVQADEVTAVDVRAANEWEAGHLPGARHCMLGHLPAQAATLPQDRPIVVHCQVGARAAIAAGILQAQGFDQVETLTGGIEAWAAAGLPVVQTDPALAVPS
ncbi:MAG: MBL fold metallo-hydrolase [Caldilineaceae bacterium]|nr:MBL fold metallo-hydrolase [Caldilineaceae bacterium]